MNYKKYAKMLKKQNQDDNFDVHKHAYSKMPKASSYLIFINIKPYIPTLIFI